MSTQDHRLDRALAALRDSPVPDGPPADTRQRTLAALHAAGTAPSPIQKRRKFMKLTLTAAAVLVIGVLFYAVGPFNGVVPAAFAEAVEKVQNASSLAYRMRQRPVRAAAATSTRAPSSCGVACSSAKLQRDGRGG